jgi:peroxiredoxin
MYLINIALSFLLILFAGCGNVKNDLFPSNADNRPAVQAGTTGPSVGQNSPDFTVSDSLGNTVTLSSVVPLHKGVVLYFTMWCPTCDSQMSYMQNSLIPAYPDVVFFAVDYVSATVADARNAEVSNGFAGSGFIVLADTVRTILNEYNGTMGTTVVIDKNNIIQMNENFKNGSKLQTVLSSLP